MSRSLIVHLVQRKVLVGGMGGSIVGEAWWSGREWKELRSRGDMGGMGGIVDVDVC